MTHIGIIGLGDVGPPRVVACAAAGGDALRLDIDPRASTAIAEGRSYIEHDGPDARAPASSSGRQPGSVERNTLRQRPGGGPSGPIPGTIDVL